MASPEVADTLNRRQYTASGTNNSFPYPFLIFEAEDIAVYQQVAGSDTVTLLTYNVDYTLTGINDTNGGNVIFVVTPGAGDIITVESDVPMTQTVDFSVGGKFDPDTVNFVNDKLTRIIQQVNMLIENRGLTYPPGAQIDQNQSTRKDNNLPVLPPNTGSGIPIWTKNSAGALIAGVCEEDAGCSTLRSEIENAASGADGASIVGYYDTIGATETTVAATLDFLLGTITPVFSTFSTGDIKDTYKTTADTGWVMMDDGTIGNAASGATTRANADTEDLFTLLWNNISDTYCPVSGGRGASAAADFAANKTINLPRHVGRARAISGLATLTQVFTADHTTEQLTVADASVYYTGTPVQLTTTGTLPSGLMLATTYYIIEVSGTVVKLASTTANAVAGTEVTFTDNGTGTHILNVQYTSRALGEYLGEENHLLVKAEIPPHTHSYPKAVTGGSPTAVLAEDHPSGAFNSSTGSGLAGDAHNNMPPTSYCNVMIKL